MKFLNFILSMAIFTGSAISVFSATYTVDNTTDNGALTVCTAAANDCSLRGAIIVANSTIENDTISFDAIIFASPQTITLTTNTSLDVNSVATGGNLTISGTGADKLTIAAGDGVTNTNRVFFSNGGNLTINGITITKGRITGIADGGGISMGSGILTINNSVITGNRSSNLGGGVSHITGTLTINNSTISNNNAAAESGGVDVHGGVDVTISNSTFNGNTASSVGGLRIIGTNTPRILITNSTFSNNSSTNTAATTGTGVHIGGVALLTNCTIAFNHNASPFSGSAGGLVTESGMVQLRNTVVAGNTSVSSTKDIFSFSGLLSLGNNLIGDNTGASTIFPIGTPNPANDLVGDGTTPVNPKLSPLANHGGQTLTHALLTTSPALETGNNCVTNSTCPINPNFPILPLVNTDQRGAVRPANGTADIGAFEKPGAVPFVAILPSGIVAALYNTIITSANGSFTYSVTGGSLPPGISLMSSLTQLNESKAEFAPQAVISLSGTPTFGGIYNFEITEDNGTNANATQYQMNVIAAPTAADASISGRITTSNGQGIRNALLILINSSSGELSFTRSSSFGDYRFSELPVGQSYILSVYSKSHSFTSNSRIISLLEDLLDANFVAVSDN